jgi:predicted ATPase
MKKSNMKKNNTKKRAIKRRRRMSLRGGLLKIEEIQQDLTVHFLQVLLMVKLFHWKTRNYATHKATDELYEKLNELFDKFIEVLLGKTDIRTDLVNQQTISLVDLNLPEELKFKIKQFMAYLVEWNNVESINIAENTDLYNIRDEILGECNKFLYLLSLS